MQSACTRMHPVDENGLCQLLHKLKKKQNGYKDLKEGDEFFLARHRQNGSQILQQEE